MYTLRRLCIKGGLAASLLALVLTLSPTATCGHTKGISLSRFGLIDISVTGNFAHVVFDMRRRSISTSSGTGTRRGLTLRASISPLPENSPTFP
jgi:hypothetical protein